MQRDIDTQLKLIADNSESPQLEVFTKLVEEEDKELPSNEEV